MMKKDDDNRRFESFVSHEIQLRNAFWVNVGLLFLVSASWNSERVVASIVALLFVIVSILKGQRFIFLALYLVFERRQCDLTNALLTTRIKRLQERRLEEGKEL